MFLSKIFGWGALCVFSILFVLVAHVEAAAIATAISTAATTTSVTVSATTTATSTASSSVGIVHDSAAVEKRVREYFADVPVMIDIARCESNFRQFTDGGAVFKGGNGGEMIGVFQLYGIYHIASALALGFDITTLDGNLAYARHLYENSGITPWSSCEPAATTVDARTQLRIELMKKLISLLQQLLAMELAAR